MPNNEDYYKALKDESYKALLNSEIQASVAKDQALKYTNQALQNSGYGSQGMAESTRLGVQNQYASALQNASNEYQSQMSSINTQQMEDQRQEDINNFDNMVSLLNEASGSNEDMDTVLGNYGIKFNDDGTWNYDQSKIGNLSDEQKVRLETAYALAKKQNDSYGIGTAFGNSSEASASWVDQDGNVGTLNDEISHFFKTPDKINNAVVEFDDNKAGLTNGDVIILRQNKYAGSKYICIEYIDGQWRQISQSNYDNAKGRKFEFYSARGNNTDYYIKDVKTGKETKI